MSTRDVRDIMGLPAGDSASKPSIAKRPKPAGQFRQKGINRELIALHGERAPPVSIIDSSKQYRAKFQRDFRPARWEHRSFANSARSDDLQLRHWRKQLLQPQTPFAADSEDVENSDPQSNGEKEYEFAKFNVKIGVPTYTNEQYETYLKSDRWSKDETDYLMELVQEYYQRWPIIIDRYDWLPSKSEEMDEDDSNTTAIAKASDVQPRELEDLKARYYQVWAQCLELAAGGEKNMSESEFALHETLSKYNPKAEKTRKGLAWQLAKRPAEEAREEEFLLSELQRIMISAQKFETERHEVRDRLEMAQPINGGNNVYTSGSSQALNSLYASLAAQDRTRKQRHRLSINVNDLAATPTTGSALPTGTPMTATGGHRESVSGSASRKGTLVNAQTPVRTLSPRRELRFGITSHDRLQSGVTFRSDKLLKLRQAKSQSQTLKIAAALAELQVPEILVLPTQRVCDSFEGLILRIGKLVEARKVLEKEEGELRVKAAIKEAVNKDGAGGEDAQPSKDGDVEMQEVDEDAEAEAEEEKDEEEDADAEADEDAEGEEADGTEVQELDVEEGEEEDEEEEDVDPDADGDAEDDDAEGEAEESHLDSQNEAVDLIAGSPEAPRPASSKGNAPGLGTRGGRKRSASIMSAASSRASRASKRTRK